MAHSTRRMPYRGSFRGQGFEGDPEKANVPLLGPHVVGLPFPTSNIELGGLGAFVPQRMPVTIQRGFAGFGDIVSTIKGIFSTPILLLGAAIAGLVIAEKKGWLDWEI